MCPDNDGWLNNNYCNGNNVWDIWRAWTCSGGAGSASCSYSDNAQLKGACSYACEGGLCTDDGYLWNADANHQKIYQLMKNGTIVDSFDSPDSFPRGLAWDGTYLWNVDYDAKKIYKLTTSGTVIDSFNSPGTYPTGLTWDGSYLWNTDTDTDKIYKLTTSGTVIDSFNSPGTYPTGLTWDGSYLWNTDTAEDKIYKLTIAGTVIDSFDSPGSYPSDLTWDGTYLWNVDMVDNKIYRLRTNSTVIASFDSPGIAPLGLAWQPMSELIECYSNSDCGTDDWIGSDYCNANDVWNTYRTYTCNNPATPLASCSYSDNDQLKDACTDTCESGICKNEGYLWHADYGANKIYKLMTNGTPISSLNSSGTYSGGLAWDGTYLWISDTVDNRIYKLTTNGALIDSFNSPGADTGGLTWDGTYLWNADTTDDKIYKLATTGTIVDSFDSPGNSPYGLTWDGTYLWNADASDDKIYQLMTNGTIINSFNSPGGIPLGLTWDGTYLWHTNQNADKIYKLMTNGTVLAIFDPPGTYPYGLAWQPMAEVIECYSDSDCGADGIVGSDYCNGDDAWETWRTWTCNNPVTPSASCSYSDNGQLKDVCVDACESGICKNEGYLWLSDFGTDELYKLTTNGTIVDSFSSPGPSPAGLTWDGEYLWHSDTSPGEIYKLTTNGTVIDSFNAPGNPSPPYPLGLAWDGTYLWNVDPNNARIYRITTSGAIMGSFASLATSPIGLTWDGEYLWHSDTSADKIYKLTIFGTVIDSFDSPGPSPQGLAWDGTYLWVLEGNSRKIYQLRTNGTVIDSFDFLSWNIAGLAWQPMSELIECYDDSYCEQDVWLNNSYCNIDDVWDTFRNRTCVNPATPSSSCIYADVDQPKEICVDTCDLGACIDVDDSAVWNPLTDKNIDEDSADGTLVYAGLKTECTDIDTPIFITITPPHAHYDLYFDGNDLKMMNMEQDWYGLEPVTLYCNGIVASFDLTVDNVNDAPVLDAILDITVDEADLVQIIPSATDADNDTLTYSFEAPLNSSGEWLTTYSDSGTYNVDVTVDDSNGGVDIQTITITVLDVLLPDLSIKSSKVLTPIPTANQWTTFQIILENIGDAVANNIYWILDTDSPENNPTYGPFDLEAGKTVDIYPAVKYTSAGTYAPVYTVDYADSILEYDETNNQVVVPVVVS